MKSFQSRQPIPIAILGTLVLILLLLAAYNVNRLPFIGDKTTYSANLANAAGLRSGDPTKVAGVIVGHVDSVSLEGDYVRVAFDVSGAWLGDLTTASVQLNTLLGQRYLELTPKGARSLNPASTIPLARTTTPYEIVPTINKLSQTVGEIDTQQLSKALDAVSATFSGTPGDVRQALDGLSRLSKTVSTRDQAIKDLLRRSNVVAGTIAARDSSIATLITDLNPLLAELQRRRAAIHGLLVGSQALSQQLVGLVNDNQKTLNPALAQLNSVAGLLERNQANLDAGIRMVGSYIHLFTNTVGVGHWFDGYVCGLLPLPLAGVNSKGC